MDPDTFNFPYTATQLSEQVNRVPNMFGMINAMGLYNSEGSISTVVEIRYEDGILRVLPAKERGGPAVQADRETGTTLFFPAPHFPHTDTILPRDIQDMLVVMNRSKRPAVLDDEVAKRLLNIRNNHAITLEYLRMGGLKGVILDGDGTELFDLFDVFGLVKKEVFFDLSNDDADIMAKCEEVTDHVMTNLKGETSTGVTQIVSSSFFNAFVQHPKVQLTWQNWQSAAGIANMVRDRTGQNWGRKFTFGNLDLVEYKGTFPVKQNGTLTSVPAVTAGKGHAYPEGTMDTFKTWFAPADTITNAANKPGDEVFISPKILDHNKGIELYSESNPLAICKRPEVLVEVSSAAS